MQDRIAVAAFKIGGVLSLSLGLITLIGRQVSVPWPVCAMAFMILGAILLTARCEEGKGDQK